MDSDLQRQFQQLLDQGSPFRFGDYFDDGIKIFKKYMGGFTGFTALLFLGMVILAFIPFVGQFGALLLYAPLSAGFYIVARKLEDDQTVTFNDFFRGFDFFGPLLLMYLVMLAATLLLMLPFFISIFTFFSSDTFLDESAPALPDFPSWSLILLLPLTYLIIAWRWAPLFIIFHRMNFWEALESSRQLISRKWWVIFLFAVAISIVGSAGYIFLLIGLFVSYPASLCIDYAAFADLTRSLGSEAGTDIEAHLID